MARFELVSDASDSIHELEVGLYGTATRCDPVRVGYAPRPSHGIRIAFASPFTFVGTYDDALGQSVVEMYDLTTGVTKRVPGARFAIGTDGRGSALVVGSEPAPGRDCDVRDTAGMDLDLIDEVDWTPYRVLRVRLNDASPAEPTDEAVCLVY